jgi:hypothetical protein
MESEKVRKGMIVVVVEGESFGCPPDTVTKVLAKPGRINDETATLLGDFTTLDKRGVLCQNEKSNRHCNNKPASYELVRDLREATMNEKKLFKLNNNQTVQI